jgi:Uma2 family endonuclease
MAVRRRETRRRYTPGVNSIPSEPGASAMQPNAAPVGSDASPHGWREVPVRYPDGTLGYREEPLAPDAFLDPQEGDHFIQGTEHGFCVNDLVARLRHHFRNDPTRAVYSEVKINWGITGLKEPAPDIAVIPDIRDRDRPRNSFRVPSEGTRPSLIIEVVSPYQDGDETQKVEIYRRAGIAEYLIVKTFEPVGVVGYSIQGYRLIGGGYRPLRPDARGLLRSRTTGLDFGTAPGHRGVVIVDVASGEPLLDAAALEDLWRQEAALREAADARADRYARRLRALGIDPDST